MDQFDDDEERGKRDGMQRVEENANEKFKAEFEHGIRIVARQRSKLTTYHVLAWHKIHGRHHTHDDRVLGPLMTKAAKAGIIEQTNEWEETGSHKRPQRVWRSLIYTQPIKRIVRPRIARTVRRPFFSQR